MMDAFTEEQLDERSATDLMGWVRGGPDFDFWLLRDPPAGLNSIFRMPVARWRPTRDELCLELLLEEVRGRGLTFEVTESMTARGAEFTCAMADPIDPPVSATAGSRAAAIVGAALAYHAGIGPKGPAL